MSLGKLFFSLGFLFLVLGFFFTFQDRLPLLSRLGKLPGDIRVEREGFSFYFPLATCVLISAALSAVGWVYRLLVK